VLLVLNYLVHLTTETGNIDQKFTDSQSKSFETIVMNALATFIKEIFPGRPRWTAADMPDLTGKACFS